jgi:ribose/xylose/arabinose/galactoside ABC-type transport system permease subunit
LQSSTRGIATIGQAFVMLSAGIDLSVYGIGILSTLVGAAIMTTRWDHNIIGDPVSASIAVPLMLLIGIIMGTVNGLLISRLRIPPLIVTFGMWQVNFGIAHLVSRGYTLTSLPKTVSLFGQHSIAGVPVPIITFVSVLAVAYFVLHYTQFGRSVYSVGGNPISAWLSGVNPRRTQLIVYMISGFLAAVAGLTLLGRMMTAGIANLRGLELDTIASTVIGGVSIYGGKGTIIGVLLGILIFGVVDNGLMTLGAKPNVLNTAKGAIIIAAVAIDQLRSKR